jgi:hypothetical protein
VEYDNENEGIGRWAFNEDSSRLGTMLVKSNGVETGEDTTISDFRWEIRELSAENLVLAIQGRHGMVVYSYRAVK